ncbi:MAG: hypothetical protein FWE66_01090 [Oscillospiraceae bacterium]|nr:hypothetical protein [Oscillospiraceae bacterium]
MPARSAIAKTALLGVAAALMIAVQVAMSPIANIELVTLFVILYTLHFRYDALYIIYVFVVAEGVIWGFHIWWLIYLYIWTILFFIAILFINNRSPIFWAAVGAVYGLLFGTLCSIPYFFIGGIAGGIAYIIAGIRFDLVHCVGNFVLILTLFKPIDFALSKFPLPERPA